MGDAVAADEPVVELETDKVTIEVPAPAAGVLEAISAQPGETVNVGSLIGESTRTAQARVTLQNPNAAWRPGLFVNVEMKRDAFEAPITVTAEAVQTLEDKPVVFVKTATGFIAQPVQVGRTDGKRVEIVQGLKAGVPYIAAGSFIAKAELGKSTASHAH